MFSNHAVAERYCTKIDIKRTMRSVLGERIVALCKNTGRNLKGKIALPASLPLALTLTTAPSQTELGGFAETSDSNEAVQHGKSATDGNDNPSDPDEEKLTGADDNPRGLIYARVSSGNQLKGDGEEDEDVEYDKGSIEGQIEELTELAQRHCLVEPV